MCECNSDVLMRLLLHCKNKYLTELRKKLVKLKTTVGQITPQKLSLSLSLPKYNSENLAKYILSPLK